MAHLLELSEIQLHDEVCRTLELKDKSTEVHVTIYTLHHKGSEKFHGIDLDNLFFVARHKYDLYYQIAHYMEKHSYFGKTMIQYVLEDKWKLIVKRDINPYLILSDERKRDAIRSLMTYKDEVTIEDVVEFMVNNIFTNDIFWAEKIKINIPDYPEKIFTVTLEIIRVLSSDAKELAIRLLLEKNPILSEESFRHFVDDMIQQLSTDDLFKLIKVITSEYSDTLTDVSEVCQLIDTNTEDEDGWTHA